MNNIWDDKDIGKDDETLVENGTPCRLPIIADREKIRSLRDKLGIAQTRMAKLLGLQPSTYSSYEQGVRSFPYDILPSIARILGVEVSDIVKPTQALLQQIIRKGEDAAEVTKTLISQVEAIYASVSRSFAYPYQDATEDEKKRIIQIMRDKVRAFFDNIWPTNEEMALLILADKKPWQVPVLGVFAGLLKYFDLCTPAAAKALAQELCNDKATLHNYLESCQNIEISLLYHVVSFLKNPLEYFDDEQNIFGQHFTPYVKYFIKVNPDFIFPLLSSDQPKLANG